ncbi:hypothetical protein DACRYDRAFT_102028 [Dacryopinax primogenitus]|uniref:MAGE domain-containing protein n=1 Tax=Dacryopinax primogenitus (strain DJM 731) TaxID=1858805 RepID=M5G310_DACPD|nr:uncharacterized protein DACRYDRAFT_102028 [Dacryopinax primogenitus]EJT98142.1 hypothetical protein DACRYDRAFT_102028 [Dacryopinax primogenitus]
MAADLVRLALFTEYKHGPLRRDEINKKVLGKYTRAFKTVFAAAQETLKDTFGMELVALKTAGHRERLVLEEADEAPDANGVTRKKIVPAGPRAWILRSCLSESIISAAAERDQSTAEAEEDEWLHLPDDPLRPERAPGTLIAWQSADDVGLQGLMFVILSLMLVNGRSMPDRIYASVPLTTASGKNVSLDTYLGTLTRLGYLDRTRTHLAALGTQAPPTQAPGRGRRGRGSDDVEEGDVSYEWRWGPRAEAEIGEKRAAEFIADVYLNRREEVQGIEDSDEEEEPQPTRRGKGRGKQDAASEKRRLKQARKEKDRREVQRILKEVERAAGGDLVA